MSAWPFVVAVLGAATLFEAYMALRLLVAHRERSMLAANVAAEMREKLTALVDRMTALENRTGRR